MSSFTPFNIPRGNFPENPEIDELYSQLSSILYEINAIAKKIQMKCPHNSNTEIRDDRGRLLQKVCMHCKLIQEKPDGPKWKVCERCWGKMEKVESPLPLPADLPIGDHLMDEYMCSNCVLSTAVKLKDNVYSQIERP